MLRSSYEDWACLEKREFKLERSPLKPLVRVPVDYRACKRWCVKNSRSISDASIKEFARVRFDEVACELMQGAYEVAQGAVEPSSRHVGRYDERDLGNSKRTTCHPLRLLVETVKMEKSVYSWNTLKCHIIRH